jgi:TonB family protein
MELPFVGRWLVGTVVPLGALWLLFRVALRREQCFGYNRALLLLAPLVAAGLPLLPRIGLPAWLLHPSGPGVVSLPSVLPVAGPVAAPLSPAGPDLSWLPWLYAAGVGLGLARLAYQGWLLHRATRHLAREPQAGYTLAYTGGRLPTSSFGHTIFWDETAALTAAEATMVLAHELAHVRQRHSYEVLWLALWRAALWPNPFVHLLVPALRLTHELLADREAVAQTSAPGTPATAYTGLLARLATRHFAGGAGSALLQPFTLSFTFTRLAMLQHHHPVRRWKQWLALPVLGGVFVLASQVEVAAQTTPPGPASQKRRGELIEQKLREAMHQDSLRTGGKFEPGTVQQVTIINASGKPQDMTVVVRRGKGPATEVPPPPPAPPVLMEQRGDGDADKNHVYTYVEQMPALATGGGMGGIIQQIQNNLVYPGGPHLEGRVFASFTVNASGEVHDAQILQGLSPAYDEAVLAAIQKLPRFVPGTQNGRPLTVSFTVPIVFKEKI